jgi:hypothetical protein
MTAMLDKQLKDVIAVVNWQAQYLHKEFSTQQQTTRCDLEAIHQKYEMKFVAVEA